MFKTHLIFQSTQPSQAVTGLPNVIHVMDSISIHTALAGSDRYPYALRVHLIISIHTALAGCDPRRHWGTARTGNFNRNRQIIIRSTVKLPQPFASWSNLL